MVVVVVVVVVVVEEAAAAVAMHTHMNIPGSCLLVRFSFSVIILCATVYVC